ncbi:glycoside hydrolase family 3 C-terminal domain-containing protein, partial [Flavobacterium sp.]|uniref:glycoside hydrolase family 3 C-terminal domain-containing protein n=1 Tax=Flavobacterium sp. TaxID=239 RepID=UPI002D01A32D
NNANREGNSVTSVQITNPIKMTTAGQHEFASGVKLEGFSAKYEAEFTAKENDNLVFKTGATGAFELFVNGKSIAKYTNWRTLPSNFPFAVEAGKKYKIEILYAQSNNWQANLEFDFGKEFDVNFTSLIQKLKGIDTVVFVGGLSTLLEGEEMPVSYPGFKNGDRTNIELPAVQRKCLKELKDAGKKVIFVNCSGSAIALTPETISCDAILQAWYPGEAGGQAVADVLFGDYNPAGKLPVSFYKNSDILGDFENYSMKNRTYRYTTDVLFPFGFGLSYSKFNIGEGKLSKSTINSNENTQLYFSIQNISKREGTEIVQVYVKKLNDTNGPLKTLKGFKRINLKAGEKQNATIDLPASSFEFYDAKTMTMKVTPGEYEVYYGNSSDAKDLKMLKVLVK